MDVRSFLSAAEARGWVRHVSATVDRRLELARVVHALGEEPTIFDSVGGWPGKVVAGLCSRRRNFALALGVHEEDLLGAMVAALRRPIQPKRAAKAPCQEIVIEDVDLDQLPILTHFPQDGGPYVTAGIAIVYDRE